MPEPGYPGSGDGANMRPPAPIPSGYIRSDIPAQQGEILGRILDPVRAAALHEAVRLCRGRSWPTQAALVTDVLVVADRFVVWLVDGEQAEQLPVDQHPFGGEQRALGAGARCLKPIGPGPDRICGRRRDDDIHVEAQP